MMSSKKPIKSESKPGNSTINGVKRKAEVKMEALDSHEKIKKALDRLLSRFEVIERHWTENRPRNIQSKIKEKVTDIEGQVMHGGEVEAHEQLDALLREFRHDPNQH